MPNLPAPQNYTRLLAQIRAEIAKSAKIIEQQKIITYWTIGRQIKQYLLQNTLPGTIGRFYEDLAEDLQINYRTLQQCEQFARLFPKLVIKEGLSWSHYRYLLSVPDQDKRERWIARIIKENMDSNSLQRELMLLNIGKENINENKLAQPYRGKLYTYRLVRANDLEGVDSSWFVDCGFLSRIETPPSDATLDNDHLFTSVKTESGYKLKTTDAKAEDLFTFKAKLIRVIDGDSLLIMVDQGFGIWRQERLRLRGLDVPELNTLKGQSVKQWLTREFKDLDFIIIKTYKSDKYDRYLVDVFYLSQEKDPQKVASHGIWLNGQLLELGLASPYSI